MGLQVRPSDWLVLALVVIAVGLVGTSGYAQDSTSVSASCSPDPISVNATTMCTVTVTNTASGTPNGTPQGTVSVSLATGSGTIANDTCSAPGLDGSGQCTFDYTPSAIGTGTHTFNLAYTSSDTSASGWSNSSGSGSVGVGGRATTTAIANCTSPLFVNQTGTCDVTVTDTDTGTKSNPQGTISFTDSTGNGTFGPCTLVPFGADAAICTVSFTPTAASVHILTATYAPGGSSTGVHAGSSGSTTTPVVTVNPRTTQTDVSCTLTTVFIDQGTVCTATVTDIEGLGTASIPSGTVTFNDAGKAGTFSAGSCALDPTGKCSVTYTPAAGDAGTTTISADYGGSTVHAASTGTTDLTVKLRTTETTISCKDSAGGTQALFVDEIGTCTVTVTDTAPGTKSSPSAGSIAVTTVLLENGPAGSATTCGALAPSGPSTSTCTFTHTRTAISGDDKTFGADKDTYAYPGSPTHAPSSGSISIAIQKRRTNTTVTCVASTSCSITVTEDPANRGTASTPTGNFLDGSESSPTTVLCPAPSCTFSPTLPDHQIVIPVTAKYSGSDKHSVSFGADKIQRDIGDFSVGTISPVSQLINGILTTCNILAIAQQVLDLAESVVSVIPDPVITALFGGSTIPIAEIAAAAVEAARNALAVIQNTICIDLDGDGLPGIIETGLSVFPGVSLSDNDPDSDDDGLTDGEEIDMAGGLFDTSFTPSSFPAFTVTVCPSPNVADSDGDTLLDGDEGGGKFQTEVCNIDTDGDALRDDEEVNGVTITLTINGVAQPPQTFRTSPLLADTDGDGVSDAVEVGANGGVTDKGSPPPSGAIGLAAVDADPSTVTNPLLVDTDLDGLTDGDEDINGNGKVEGTACVTTPCVPAGGTETDPNLFDSDTDGLGDGFELGSGSGCDPVDIDTDDDLLSDSEEVNETQTTCSVADSDGDGLSDADEHLVLSGTFPTRNLVQVSDPLIADTDGDGIPDDIEYPGGSGIGTGPGPGTADVCGIASLFDGFVNDSDSDDDGLPDGSDTSADVGAAEANAGELSDDATVGICDPDSDGDGLKDGLELSQGTDMRDWDSDDDGLSDREELEIYFTDPNLADTDGDGADGVIATRTPTFTDAAHPLLGGYAGGDTIDCKSDCEEVFSGTLLFNPFAAGPFGNPLDETDPLQQDTDGDGITDDIEFAPGCNDGPGGPGTGPALFDGYANSFDSDADGLRDLEDAVADVFDGAPGQNLTPVSRSWQTYPETPAPAPGGTKVAGDGVNDGEINDDAITGICDPDSDGDGVLDGEEHQIGTDPYDWDSDDDGRGDGEFLGEGPIPSDPLDFDTDDDGLGDGVEVFGANPTNPVAADTDGDGLCDGGATTPASTQFGPAPGPGAVATGGVDGAGSNALCYTGVAAHPNDGASTNAINPTPSGWGEDVDGDGTRDDGETDPNDFDTDGDAVGDGVEVLAFYVSRQSQIPATDLFGRAITVTYPQQDTFVCLDPLNPDSDGDGLLDGVEDLSHDGIFDFEPGDFDHAGQGPIPGPAQDNPEETNPCDPDTDDDGLSDFEERNQPNPPAGSSSVPQPFAPFNPTNPLDHDTDNDWLLDGEEVAFVCTTTSPEPVDNDGDGAFDEDPLNGLDDDLDGLIDEDPPDFQIDHVDFLDPTNRDSDFDSFIDGLDPDPCNSPLIPIVGPVQGEPVDTDGDGFADDDERVAGTDPFNPDDHPTAFVADLDLDLQVDDRLWLEDSDGDGEADSVAIDLGSNVLLDIRIQLVKPRDVATGDFDGDGAADDRRYTVEYALANGRVLQPRLLLVIEDLDGNLVIDRITLERVGR